MRRKTRSLALVRWLAAPAALSVRPFLFALGCALQLGLPQSRAALLETYHIDNSPQAPPPAAAPQTRAPATGAQLKTAGLFSVPAGLTLYSIGDPTDQEQLYLELLNRARANPAAEALDLESSTDSDVLNAYSGFKVDLASMVTQISAIAPAPPLSMNPLLTASARGHSQDMLVNGFQLHDGSDGSTFATRATAAGYNWNMIAENIYASAHSVEEGTAAFEVDWGGDASTGGMQSPPGHRLNDHSTNYVEIGIGVVSGTNGIYGPNSVTEDFGRRSGLTPFITGVVYYDLNGNGVYDLGEGLGGVTVLVSGSSYYAMTATAGGYSVPVPGDGTYSVSFQVLGAGAAPFTASVSGNNSVKLDYPLSYTAPSIQGLGTVGANQAVNYSFSPVPGATAYQFRQDQLVPATVEGAENGLNNVTVTSSPGYSVLDSGIHAAGSFSFHLAQPSTPGVAPSPQTLLLNPTFELTSSSQLVFASRLGVAAPEQVARAQVSVDGGQTWQDVWSQPGTGVPGESSFNTHTIALSNFAGKAAQIRFVYDFIGGNFYPQTDPGVGLYLDNILVQNANELGSESVVDIPSGSAFTFTPSQTGTYALSVRPSVSGRFLPWGSPKMVTVQSSPVSIPSVKISGFEALARGRLAIDFTVTNPSSGGYAVQSKSDLAKPWTEDTTATIQATQGSTGFRAEVAPGPSGNWFYRIVAK